MIATGMPDSLAFLTTGISASGSEGASTMPTTPRLMAFSTRDTWSATADSEAGPLNDTVCSVLPSMAATAPLFTFCQKLELVVLTITAISPAMPTAGTRLRAVAARHALSSIFISNSSVLKIFRSTATSDLVDKDRQDTDDADDDLLDERRYARHVEAVAKYTDDEGADHGPGDRAHAAHQRRAADNGRGNRI